MQKDDFGVMLLVALFKDKGIDVHDSLMTLERFFAIPEEAFPVPSVNDVTGFCQYTLGVGECPAWLTEARQNALSAKVNQLGDMRYRVSISNVAHVNFWANVRAVGDLDDIPARARGMVEDKVVNGKPRECLLTTHEYEELIKWAMGFPGYDDHDDQHPFEIFTGEA